MSPFEECLDRLVRHVTGSPASQESLRAARRTDPAGIETVLAGALAGQVARIVVSGTFDRRLAFLDLGPEGGWLAADLSGEPHATRAWPAWTADRITLERAEDWLSPAAITRAGVTRLLRPRLLLVALYHPEYFPLPRFPLAISDVARAARSTLLGQVRLVDMQLGTTLDGISEAVEDWQPDILGVSATFGQHDLMVTLLDHVFALESPPLVLAGGSLTARNERILLDRYPRLLVARGAGEPTIQDVLGFWHNDLDLADVRGVGYRGAPRGGGLAIRRFRHNPTVNNRAQTDIFPELDLLDATFDHKGVAQLETSRGCTNYCSFCPRGHKGIWAGAASEQLGWILAGMREVFDRHPRVSRTLYLVDEEFIGRGEDSVPRALAVARTVHDAGFRWETSCRVDQVVATDRDTAWHVERVEMWRRLIGLGLRRCLFGVESGVTSILDRFNKETTGEQNALAIRTLSALGVPTRFTYITFDHLMSLDELRQTHAYQGRRDLILRPLPHLSAEEIVAGVRDDAFVAEHAAGRPFYQGISYMLVSMECLIGAAYTKQVEAAGLATSIRPAMGRVDADFVDWRIGRCSHHAQLWIDRNFALDYTLKSLEKILDGEPYHAIRRTRTVIKDMAYSLLGGFLWLVETAPGGISAAEFDTNLVKLMDAQLDTLRARLASTIEAIQPVLPDDASALLHREHDRWRLGTSWELINAADACDT